jgi:hypothetical protein
MCGEDDTRLGALNEACATDGSAKSKRKGKMFKKKRLFERSILTALFSYL